MNWLDDSRRSRLLALALLLVPFLVIWVLVVAPVTDTFAQQQERHDMMAARLSAFEARRAEIPELEKHLAEVERHSVSSRGLLRDNTASLGAASIQGRIRPLLGAHGAELRSIQSLPPSTEKGFERIPVQYILALPPNALRDFLYELETVPPYLFIEEFSIRASELRTPLSRDARPESLDIQMKISGYRWVGAEDE